MKAFTIFGVVFVMLGAPASAQRAGPPAPAPALPADAGPRPGTGRDVVDLDQRIRTARRNGEISRRVARRAHREADYVADLDQRYAVGGTSAAEQRELDTRATVLRDQINAERTRAPRR